jgi:alpha-galactosidase/6-phospho-beta-glucosidase family protein
MFHPLLFVDDSTFFFETLYTMENGAQNIHDHYARFRLVMHAGRGDKKSKTKAMYEPATLNQEPIREGMRIDLRGGSHIHFTKKFKYLGSKVTSKLRDSLDVKTRIAIANSQMDQMKELFRYKDTLSGTTKFLYRALPLINVLWGCETWALKDEEKRMLEVFHHGAIIRIIGISRQIVHDERITNSAARKKFLNIPTRMNLAKRRVLKNIGKVVREEKETELHKYVLTTYCYSPMHVGGQQKSHRDLFITYVRTILPDTPASAPLKTWIHETQNEGKWNALIIDWWESLDDEDDEEEHQHTESQTETPITQDVTSHEEEEEHTTNVFNSMKVNVHTSTILTVEPYHGYLR